MNVVGKLTESLWEEGGAPKPPGSYKFYRHQGSDESAGLHFVCPCGCGVVAGIAFLNPPGQAGPKWTWNGNREKPTCTPSILKLSGCRWHGYLTDGVFRSC